MTFQSTQTQNIMKGFPWEPRWYGPVIIPFPPVLTNQATSAHIEVRTFGRRYGKWFVHYGELDVMKISSADTGTVVRAVCAAVERAADWIRTGRAKVMDPQPPREWIPEVW